ncbi:hypothetical protein CPB84DRAFT_1792691 [Gymnopilus junonius]|uniref:Peregrin n=1 Tax=Gymnopilus junonius TaxID=109634 RepID=A0A9P5NBG4_GYMJU|nr:hypothetical protein CPB84DRAFT_1792691 [Gymnopilus junonius]
MARGHHGSPANGDSLPKVEFQIIHDDKLKLPGGTHVHKARIFGYNDFSHFHRPEHYIRHIEPLESDLAKTVEYDMDEQDQEWLDAVNIDRKKGQTDAVTTEAFEIIMDRLEKEWFDLTKNIPKPDFAMPSEDSTCAICDDSEGENSNAIVFCDGCNLAVHQDCYGVPYIPEGQWLCRKCTVSPENPVSCFLCPNEGGAFKQTTHGEWVHLLCAIWIPETRVANEVFMEPVTGVERISKQRWKLRCSVCDVRQGACIQCTKPSCFVAFHATCARKEKFLMPMKSAHGAEPASLTCYCDRHLPPEQQEIRAKALENEEKTNRTASSSTNKSARAYAKTYKPGPPLVPAIVVKRIMEYTNKIKLRKKIDFIQQVCRYWSLKREARRGAPLLKRLHLEPWTASSSAKVLTEEEKLMRLHLLKSLRQDLVKVHALTDLVRKREIRKQRQMDVVYDVLSQGLFPAHVLLRDAFERIQGMDNNDHFKYPVSKTEVPDYYDVVKNPMCWSDIDTKLDNHKYWNLKEFRDDIELVFSNALLYNKSGTPFHKSATRLRKDSKGILDSLEPSKFAHDPSSWSNLPKPPKVIKAKAEGEGVEAEGGADEQEQEQSPIGDLEPPVNVLELFMTSDAIKEDLNMELNGDPVSTLLEYMFAKVKPPPLTPPSPLPPRTAAPADVAAAIPATPSQPPKERIRKSKPKRDRKAEIERARVNKVAKEAATAATSLETEEDYDAGEEGDNERRTKERDLQAALDASAGFRAPKARVPSGSQAPESSLAEGSRPRKPVSAAPSSVAIPRVVESVGNRDSFSFFNTGWILPSDQKRGGRVATERQILPPPRKRQKTDHAGSRMSTVSTVASESNTAQRTPLYFSDHMEVKHNPDESMEIDLGGDRPPIDSVSRGASLVGDADGQQNVVMQPNGTVIIEKLDTPAIRRERNLRKKVEKQKREAVSRGVLPGDMSATVSATSSNLSQPTSSAQPPPSSVSSRPPVLMSQSSSTLTQHPLLPPDWKGVRSSEEDGKDLDQDGDFESELSELSEEEEEEEEDSGAQKVDQQPQPVPVPAPQPIAAPVAPAQPKLKAAKSVRPKRTRKIEVYEDGSIVWAKSDAFPWWPALVYADNNPDVPENILQEHKAKRTKRKIKLFIIQYFDKQKSWQSVPRDKLRLLGEDEKVDAEMLQPSKSKSNKNTKWRTPAHKQTLQEAYKTALSAMCTDDSSSNSSTSSSRPGPSGDDR